MRIPSAFVWLGLLAATSCQKNTDAVADEKTVAPEAPQTISRADALSLLPDGVNFLASVDMKALRESGSFDREFGLLSSVEALDPLVACGLDFGHLTYFLLAGNTNTESNFIAIMSSPKLGVHTLECLAEDGQESVAVENGRSVVTEPASQAKIYAVSPGLLAMAAPQQQTAFAARLDGQGQPALGGSMRDAVASTDFDADVAFALVSDEELTRDAPGLLSIAVQASVADGLALELVSIFDAPELADRTAEAIDLEIWQNVAKDIGVPVAVVDSVRVDVQGTVAKLQARATQEELRSISDIVTKTLREELEEPASDHSRSATRSQAPDDLDSQFLKRLTSNYRADWSDGDHRSDYYERCLARFVPELDDRIRETYCLCVAHNMSADDADAAEANEECGVMLFPVIFRSAGLEECELLHGERACSCWVEARETSKSGYSRASRACLDEN